MMSKKSMRRVVIVGAICGYIVGAICGYIVALVFLGVPGARARFRR